MTQFTCERCNTNPALHDIAKNAHEYEHVCAACLTPAEAAQ